MSLLMGGSKEFCRNLKAEEGNSYQKHWMFKSLNKTGMWAWKAL